MKSRNILIFFFFFFWFIIVQMFHLFYFFISFKVETQRSRFLILSYVNSSNVLIQIFFFFIIIFSIWTFYFNPEDTFWLCFIRDILAS